MRTGVLAIALALAFTGSANAATLSVKDQSVVFQAAAGETNKPYITSANGTIAATDSGATMSAGPGCAIDPSTPNTVRCPAHTVNSLVVRLADGDDVLRANASEGVLLPETVKLSVEAGRGNDTVFGTTRDDNLMGESGADVLYGRGGRDKIVAGSGSDRLQGQGRLYGQSGNDRIFLFVSRGTSGGVRSKAYGGAGNDRIVGSNRLRDIIDCGLSRNDIFRTTDRRGLDRFNDCEHHTP